MNKSNTWRSSLFNCLLHLILPWLLKHNFTMFCIRYNTNSVNGKKFWNDSIVLCKHDNPSTVNFYNFFFSHIFAFYTDWGSNFNPSNSRSNFVVHGIEEKNTFKLCDGIRKSIWKHNCKCNQFSGANWKRQKGTLRMETMSLHPAIKWQCLLV